jgi:outer membrane protein insertion porin family
VDPTTGEPFNFGDLTKAQQEILIEKRIAITDYQYALVKNETIDDAYKMEYDSYNITLGGSTGYTFVTPYGRIGLATRLNTALSYVQYDKAIYRPHESVIRDNLGTFLPNTKQIFNVTFDSRDIIYSPTKGFYVKQSLTYNGGILPSTRDYNLSTSKAQAFFKLFDVPVTDTWNFTGVLALNSSIAFILDQYAQDSDGKWRWLTNITAQELLYVDGMTMARGWQREYGQKILWDNWIELRIPIAPQYVWWDFFFSGTGFWDEYREENGLKPFEKMEIDDFYFGFGGGARLTIPGFPIGLYFTKRFKYVKTNSGAFDVIWQRGNVFGVDDVPWSGIDFVISFTADLY